jgi:hypothetical protein
MNEPLIRTTDTATFVVRFWREWAGHKPRWRGRIEHVQSGRQADFLEVKALIGFLERFGISAGGDAAGREDGGRCGKQTSTILPQPATAVVEKDSTSTRDRTISD